ncbi:DigA protein [Phellopilus nigrolimitatus]|nr:DigA protein [Phellopilus nigrolimitatus]
MRSGYRPLSSTLPRPQRAFAQGSFNLPKLDYQGFEPSPYDDTDERENVEDLLEGGQYPNLSAPAGPIFELGKVQFDPPAPLVSLAVSSDLLVMGLSNNFIIMIELSHPEHVVKLPIQRKPNEMTLYKVFLDPSSRHLIVTSTQGENWYLFRGWKKFKQLKNFKMVIESIAWNKAGLLSSSNSTSSKEFLVGARNGTVHEALLDAEEDFFKSQERYVSPVFSLPERPPITGIHFQLLPPLDPKQAVVVITTPSRIYQLAGSMDKRSEDGNRLFASLFAKYRDTAPRIMELPGNTLHSELHFFTSSADQAQSLPKAMAWMTAQGIYHGTMNLTSNSDDFIDSAQLLPYPAFDSSSSSLRNGTTTTQDPLSICLTEFHFVLLYKDRVVGVSNLNDALVYEEALPLKPNEVVRGLTADPVRKTYWVYTDSSLFELGVANEARDVWQVYLDKGMFDVALRYAKTASQRDQVLIAQADRFFKDGQYIHSAQSYAQCSASFEEREALRYYLVARLERTRKSDLTQRMMLATWLVEIYLARCNELEDIAASESVSHDVEDLRTERTLLEDELRQFFQTYKDNLDTKAVYELIQSHGRTDIYLHFAMLVGDLDRVAEHWILEEEWIKAIDVLSRQAGHELYYRFAPVLMRQAPKETVESWLRQPALDPLRLVPALLRTQSLSPSLPRDPLQPNYAIRYLNHVVFSQGHTAPTIHNLLVTFHVSCSAPAGADEEGPLLRFLSTAPSDPLTGKPYYDLDYALRLCIRAGKTRACVQIYSKMGLWENSVDLALEKGDLELAKINADMPEDDRQLRKKLWLKIAKYVVQDKKDIKSAMAFLDSTDILKIEDILPFFPDFVVIDDFKEEICTALEGYSAHIDSLKAEMDDTTKNAEAIKADIKALRNRFVVIDAGDRCTECHFPLLARQFYVFPCQHTFHVDCLIGLAKEYLSAASLRRIIALQNDLLKTAQQLPQDRLSITNPMPGLPASPAPRNTGQRALLSANFAAPVQNSARAANSLGRNILSAGDKLRDLIIPESLASVVSAGMWSTGLDRVIWSTGDKGEKDDVTRKVEKAREELDELLAGSCPLCENVVAGLDRPFLKEGENDDSWQI